MQAEWEGQQQENEPESQNQALDDSDEDEDILDMGEDDQVTNNDKESLLMRFCPNDSSMLYPQVSSVNQEEKNGLYFIILRQEMCSNTLIGISQYQFFVCRFFDALVSC